MVLVFAPVDAVADRGPARRQPVRVDAEPGERRAAAGRERVPDVVRVGRRPVAYGFVGPALLTLSLLRRTRRTPI
jgi:hypothetical protein